MSLYLSLRAKKSDTLATLRAADLTVHDGATIVDSHEIRLSREGDHPLLTLVFDRLDAADLRHAAGMAQKMLKQVGTPALPIAVWSTDSRLRVVQSYTTDRPSVARALQTVATGKDEAIAAAAEEQEKRLAEHTVQGETHAEEERRTLSRQSLTTAAQIAGEQHFTTGMAALLAAAAEERTLPGRKVIVEFTEAVPSGLNAGKVLRSLYEQLSEAGISLYVVDLRALDRTADQGMMAALAMGAQTASNHAAVAAAAPPRPGTNPNAPTGKTMNLTPSEFQQMTDTIANIEMGGVEGGSQNPLASVAMATGGAYTDVDGNLAKLGRTIDADVANCYKLTFPVPAGARDGSFHIVLVNSALKGVTAAAPLGYFAVAPGNEEGAPSLETRARDAQAEWKSLARDVTATDLQIRAGIRRGTPSAKAHEIAVQVPVGQLELRKDATTHLLSLHATLAAELEDGAGKPVAQFTEEFQRRGALENEEKVRTTVLTMLRPLEVPAGEYRLHAVVRDWYADKLGEVTEPVVVGAAGGVETSAAASVAAGERAAAAHDSITTAAVLEAAERSMVERGLSPVVGEPPSADDTGSLIAAARANALSYADSLPNFFCVERIDRSTDPKGTGVWKHRDAMLELLRYRDKTESRTMLEVNGEKSSVAADRVEGARSNGEFGDILRTIFEPDAGATFTWQKSVQQDGETLQVFQYRIDQPRSQFFVSDHSGLRLRAGLHGLVYLDANTRAVRRLVAQTDGLPASFGVRASWMAVEYDYIAINNHEYLLPTRGEVGLAQRKQDMTLLQLRFSDYRRFGSHSKIIYPGPHAAEKP